VNWQAGFDQLEVGQEFETRGRVITEADVSGFATLTGDMHPQHTDPKWAARSPFGERIAHGMLVLSCAVGLAPLDPERVLALRRVREVVFKRPVLLGDTVRLRGGVTQLLAVSDEAGLVTCRWAITNQREQLCARAEVEVLWRRDPVVSEVA
jgi:acyl dehydratase